MLILTSTFGSFMFWIYAFIIFVLVLGTIIMIHEGGHFFFAKKAGVLCHEFSIGMGPVIKQWKKGETSYSIRAIPVGGFVAMAGEDTNESMLKPEQQISLNFKEVSETSLKVQVVPKKKTGEEENKSSVIEESQVMVNAVSEIILDEKITGAVTGTIVDYDLYSLEGNEMYINLLVDGEEKHFVVARDAFYIYSQKQKIQIAPYDRCMESKSKWAQFKTIFAGPMMNFVLALFVFIIVGLAAGVPNYDSTVIGDLTGAYPAQSVLKVGDKILEINDSPVASWTEFSSKMGELNGEEEIKIKVSRDGEEFTYTISTIIVSYRLGIANFDSYEKAYDGEGLMISLVYSDDYVAGKAGLVNGDIITGYYDSDTLVTLTSWKQILDYLDENPNMKSIKLQYKHVEDGTTQTKETTSSVWTQQSLKELNVGQASKTAIGVSCKTHFSFFGGLGNAFVLFWQSVSTVFMTLFALFSNSQISINDLSGPVGIFTTVKAYLGTDFVTFMSFVGLISANIGVVNLLPIPALDGGRILFLIIEAITRKKINKKAETIINNVVFWLVMALFVYITVKDVIRLF